MTCDDITQYYCFRSKTTLKAEVIHRCAGRARIAERILVTLSISFLMDDPFSRSIYLNVIRVNSNSGKIPIYEAVSYYPILPYNENTIIRLMQ